MHELSPTERRTLRKAAEDFLGHVKERLNECILLGDTEGFDEVVKQFSMVLDFHLLRDFRRKGLEADIRALADKAGRITLPNLEADK